MKHNATAARCLSNGPIIMPACLCLLAHRKLYTEQGPVWEIGRADVSRHELARAFRIDNAVVAQTNPRNQAPRHVRGLSVSFALSLSVSFPLALGRRVNIVTRHVWWRTWGAFWGW